MRFGLFFLPLASTHAEAQAEYDQMLAECVEAEAQGFDQVWFTEHHFDRYGGIMPSPFVMMAAAARLTRRIRLGTAVAVLPFSDPVRLAEEAAMVDVLSNGRVDLGVGRGFMPHEFATVAMNTDERDAKVLDGWRTITTIWDEGGASYAGKTTQFHSLRLLPRPTQAPHPPLWMAASVTRTSFETAGKYGFHLMLNPYNRTQEELDRGLTIYRDAAVTAGHAWESRKILVNFPLFLAESPSEARNGATSAFRSYLSTMEDAFQKNGEQGRISSGDYDSIAAKVMFGTPDEIAGRLRAWQTWGATDICLMTRFAGLSVAAARHSRELFMRYVAPRLQ